MAFELTAKSQLCKNNNYKFGILLFLVLITSVVFRGRLLRTNAGLS